MKRRAIAKIIVCSIIGAVLISVLCAAIGWNKLHESTDTLNNALHEAIDSPVIREGIEITNKTLSGLPVPRIRFFGCAPVITLEDGDLSFGGKGTVPSGYSEGNGGYETAPDRVEIDWAAGSVFIVAKADASGVSLFEYAGDLDPIPDGASGDYAVPDDNRMIHKLSGGTLKVEQFRRGIRRVGVQETYRKTLVVVLPESALSTLRIDAASVKLNLDSLKIYKLDLDLAAGSLSAADCAIDEVNIDSAAGSGAFTACSIGRLDLDFASGSMDFDLLNTPDKVNVDAATGKFRFTLPADASFAVKADSLSGSVTLEGFDSSAQNGRTVVNGGSSSFEFDLMSSSVVIAARTDGKY